MKSQDACAVAFSGLLLTVPAMAENRDRAAVPEKYRWNLLDLYAGDEAWKAAKEKLAGEMSAVEAFRGTLAQGPDRLLSCLDLVNRIARDFGRLQSYAFQSSDQDTRVT
jgi:oligoendopeptidase F